jgi:hypothetical protein
VSVTAFTGGIFLDVFTWDCLSGMVLSDLIVLTGIFTVFGGMKGSDDALEDTDTYTYYRFFSGLVPWTGCIG